MSVPPVCRMPRRSHELWSTLGTTPSPYLVWSGGGRTGVTDATRPHVWGNTEAYEAYMGRWSRPVAEAVLAWLRLSPGLTWLDVGCGTGALTEAILDAADPSEIHGVDPSADFIATAEAQIVDPRVD